MVMFNVFRFGTRLSALAVIAACLAAPDSPSWAGSGSPAEYDSASVRFGDFLFERGDYRRALIEYLRCEYMDSGRASAGIQLRLGRTRLRIGEFEQAGRSFSRGAESAAGASVTDSLRFGIEAARIASRHVWSAPFSFDRDRAGGSVSLSERACALEPLDLMVAGRWGEADEFFRSAASVEKRRVMADPSDAPEWSDLAKLAEDGYSRKPNKSPALAAVMSAVVPGSGKVYSGRAYDGLYSLVALASTVWLSYEGFRDNGVHGASGWIFGGLSAFFYGGNIYGSYAAAQNYNDDIDRALGDRLDGAVLYWIEF